MGLIDNVLGARSGGGGMSPITMALLGLLAYRTLHGKGRLADMLGQAQPDQAGAAAPQPHEAGGGLGGLLGGLMGGGGPGSLLGEGGAGGMLSGGLSDLVRQFQQNGQGDTLASWIGSGQNKPIAPNELEQALGEERIAWLMRETGLTRDQLLQGLSHELPQAVDRLTPQGRIPNAEEANAQASETRPS